MIVCHGQTACRHVNREMGAAPAAGADPINLPTEIEHFFREKGLPLQAARALTDPEGEYAYECLKDLAELVIIPLWDG